jgi:hypothetical protein
MIRKGICFLILCDRFWIKIIRLGLNVICFVHVSRKCVLLFLIKMSKVQSSVLKYVAGFGENVFASDGRNLLCQVCEIKVNSVSAYCHTTSEI